MTVQTVQTDQVAETADLASAPEARMTLEELKAWILAQGTEEFELFARNCWSAAS
ncbi:hypothetical protein GXW83_24065 [Streptacidiphilus sp. PB12-B1b]|uniref:hypothetical protein n=1 Tax=Streptacidiphilus sp. PB12-B1b TaxID=2705012 RepID=UPI0015F7A734|nr:hypothetical protein [Streptacidiphilus sp. PB12-B1b]QMU78325.1 hypothetical protein GXW83_24065 [Streptacidiphilus sp. PB12-B1b]